MNTRVTLGICAKNAEKTIGDTVESIMKQGYPSKLMKLILVDGRSTDKTVQIVIKATWKEDLRPKLYSDEGHGLGAARQIVVDNAEGKYVIYVDADVRLFDDFVENHVRFMEENPEIGVAYGRPMHLEGTLVATVWDLYHFTAGGFRGTDATIFRLKALTEAGGFDRNIRGASEDSDLIGRMKARGWLTAVNRNARFFHRFRENFKQFWDEQSWFGYGDHYRYHKSGKPMGIDKLPGSSLILGLRSASKSFAMTHKKISFLIPFQMAFRDLAWWSGLIKGHIDGYGH